MKTLYLLRHAKSSWDDPKMRDFDRPLNETGLRDAPRMAARLGELLREGNRELGIILCSPALRTRTTAEMFASLLNVPSERIQLEPQIYLASSGRLLQLVRRLDDSAATAMIVGHNPALTDFANDLGKAAIENIPACGLVALEIDAEQWSQTEFGNTRCASMEVPGKEPAGEPVRQL